MLLELVSGRFFIDGADDEDDDDETAGRAAESAPEACGVSGGEAAVADDEAIGKLPLLAAFVNDGGDGLVDAADADDDVDEVGDGVAAAVAIEGGDGVGDGVGEWEAGEGAKLPRGEESGRYWVKSPDDPGDGMASVEPETVIVGKPPVAPAGESTKSSSGIMTNTGSFMSLRRHVKVSGVCAACVVRRVAVLFPDGGAGGLEGGNDGEEGPLLALELNDGLDVVLLLLLAGEGQHIVEEDQVGLLAGHLRHALLHHVPIAIQKVERLRHRNRTTRTAHAHDTLARLGEGK